MYDISRRSIDPADTDKAKKESQYGRQTAPESLLHLQRRTALLLLDARGRKRFSRAAHDAIEPAAPASWSPDGQVLAFVQSTTDSLDISVLRLEGEPRPFIPSPFEEQFPTFSPDGRWLAYISNPVRANGRST